MGNGQPYDIKTPLRANQNGKRYVQCILYEFYENIIRNMNEFCMFCFIKSMKQSCSRFNKKWTRSNFITSNVFSRFRWWKKNFQNIAIFLPVISRNNDDKNTVTSSTCNSVHSTIFPEKGSFEIHPLPKIV